MTAFSLFCAGIAALSTAGILIAGAREFLRAMEADQ